MAQFIAQIALLLAGIVAMLGGAVVAMTGAVEIVMPVLAPHRAIALATLAGGLILFIASSLLVAALAVPV